MSVFGTFRNDAVTVHQYVYPHKLYNAEVRTHEQAVHEYGPDILHAMAEILEATRPNVRLFENQPYVNAVVRHKLVDFLLKMAVRLKILPFVFCRAVRYFDRYCLKRIVLLDQAQLIITTCLWIAAKVGGGNNHFANLADRGADVASIADLGYGLGARFRGPTERFRLPKLAELVKLCGLKCRYDAAMFKQMEVHVMNTLQWQLLDPSVDEYVVYSHELQVVVPHQLAAFSQAAEFLQVKQFVAYAACYVHELMRYDTIDVAKVLVALVNDTFQLEEHDTRYQTLNHAVLSDGLAVLADFRLARDIHRLLVRAVVTAPAYLLQTFSSRGPQALHLLLSAGHRAMPVVEYTYAPAGPAELCAPALYARTNGSQASLWLALTRDDVFDEARGLATPASSDEEYVVGKRIA